MFAIEKVLSSLHVRHSVKNKGTVACCVRVQLSKKQAEKVWGFFALSGEALRFSSSEVASQGYGWYEIFGRVIHGEEVGKVDAALDGLRHVLFALSGIGVCVAALKEEKEMVWKGPAKYYAKVLHVTNRKHASSVVVCRAKQAAQADKEADVMSELRALLGKATQQNCMTEKVAQFNAVHHH
jgi:hypothetical protein